MTKQIVDHILSRHSFLKSVNRVESISGGFSHDNKYVLYDTDRAGYLLRLSNIAVLGRRREEFNILRIHHKNGIACPKPYAFGSTDDGQCCYSILSYICGHNAEDALPLLSSSEQFDIGIQAGRELYKLHQLPGKETHDEWQNRRIAKYRRRVQQARDLGLGFQNQEEIERFVENQLGLLRTSLIRYQRRQVV